MGGPDGCPVCGDDRGNGISQAGLKDDSKPETGNVVEGKTDVTYVYEKAGRRQQKEGDAS